MLVLQRKENESIMIGDDIKVTIVRTQHSNVRIGIDAPEEIEIMREELIGQRQFGGIPVVQTTLGPCESGGVS